MTLAYQLLLSKDLIHHYRSTRDLKKGAGVQRKESMWGMYITRLFCILLALRLSSARDKVIGDSGRVTNMNETLFPLQGIQNPASFKYKIFQRSLLCLSLNTIGLLSMFNARKLFSVERRKGNTNKHNEIFSIFLCPPKWYLTFTWQRTEPSSLRYFSSVSQISRNEPVRILFAEIQVFQCFNNE